VNVVGMCGEAVPSGQQSLVSACTAGLRAAACPLRNLVHQAPRVNPEDWQTAMKLKAPLNFKCARGQLRVDVERPVR
jgi:hypothetical protein